MGKRGPTATPKVNLASWRADARGEEPVSSGELSPPDNLNEQGLKVWNKVIKYVQELDVTGGIDSIQLARYCEYTAQYLDCRAFLDQNGYVYTANDIVKPFPQAAMMNEAHTNMTRIEREFGFTPGARASLAISGPKKSKAKDKTQAAIDDLLK